MNVPSKNTAPFAVAQAEMEAVFKEGSRLEGAGRLDSAVAAQIDAQMQEISARLDREVAARMAEVEARHAATRPLVLPLPYRMPFAVGCVLLVVGAVLELEIGSTFIPSFADRYRTALPWMFGALVPALGLGWLLLERRNHALRMRSPTWAVRWLILFPGVVVLSAALVIFAPPGWAAAFGWAFGERAERLDGRLLSVNAPSPTSKGCRQSAVLAFGPNSAKLCVDRLMPAEGLRAGDPVWLAGRLSALGLRVESIRKPEGVR